MIRSRLATGVVWGGFLSLAWIATPAGAHSLAPGGGGDLAGGFAHPFSGLDHQLAMLAIGLWSAQLSGRARLAPPLLFVAGAAIGLALGALAPPPPTAGALLSGSVVALGIGLGCAIRTRLALAAASSLAFGVLHGHAHACDVAACVSPADFAAGFLLASLLLHAAGFALAAWAPARARLAWTRAAGGAIAVTGGVLLAIAIR